MNIIFVLLLYLTAGDVVSPLQNHSRPHKDDMNSRQRRTIVNKPLKGLVDLMGPAQKPARRTAKKAKCVIPFVYETEKDVYIFYDCTSTLNPQGREWCSLKPKLYQKNTTYGDWDFCV